MSLSLLPTQDAIITKLNELPQTVYENTVPTDDILQYSDGQMLPFIVALLADILELLKDVASPLCVKT